MPVPISNSCAYTLPEKTEEPYKSESLHINTKDVLPPVRIISYVYHMVSSYKNHSR